MTASKIKITILSLTMLLGASLTPTAFAQLTPANTGLTATADATALKGTSTDITLIAAKVIDVVIGTLGILLFFYIIWGGFKWMTARGDSKKTEDATKIMTNAVIGTLIILSSYALATFTITQLGKATDGTTTAPTTTTTTTTTTTP